LRDANQLTYTVELLMQKIDQIVRVTRMMPSNVINNPASGTFTFNAITSIKRAPNRALLCACIGAPRNKRNQRHLAFTLHTYMFVVIWQPEGWIKKIVTKNDLDKISDNSLN
jgi:hypothetical protein